MNDGADATVGSCLGEIAANLAEVGFDDPRRRARRLLATALGISQTDVFAHPERRLSPAERSRIALVLQRILAHEPLSRITGEREFWGLPFRLAADTLDPRPETELVVEAVLARLPERGRPYRFLDLGTGTGCLLLALLSECPAATGVGVDVALGAAITARDNARTLGLTDRARFAVGDWGAALGTAFDVVVSNPPYIETGAIADLPSEVRDFDPRRALDGGADGLTAYRAIAADLPRLLKKAGVFAAEIGAGQDEAVAALLRGAGLRVESVLPDLAGIPRCVVARRR